jgi:hypothetical protein
MAQGGGCFTMIATNKAAITATTVAIKAPIGLNPGTVGFRNINTSVNGRDINPAIPITTNSTFFMAQLRSECVNREFHLACPASREYSPGVTGCRAHPDDGVTLQRYFSPFPSWSQSTGNGERKVFIGWEVQGSLLQISLSARFSPTRFPSVRRGSPPLRRELRGVRLRLFPATGLFTGQLPAH